MKRLHTIFLGLSFCFVTLSGCQSSPVVAFDVLQEFKLKYPEIVSRGDIYNIRMLEIQDAAAEDAINSTEILFLETRPLGVIANSPVFRIAKVTGNYFLISESGFGMSVVRVFGPLKF